MIERLGSKHLKSGENVEILCVTGPNVEWQDRIAPFLGHKGDLWQWHITAALSRSLDSLKTRFYLGLLSGEIVGNICTFESGPEGILGHVFTRPDQRRKGICEAMMAVQTEDFRRRGGRLMTLGTGFDSAAYHIYERFGFRSIAAGSGTMRQDVVPGYLEAAMAAAPAAARAMRWGDWPRLNALSFADSKPTLRGLVYGIIGQTNLESGGLRMLNARENDHKQGAWVLESSVSGAVVGLATIAADPLWRAGWILDFWVLPAFESQSGLLLGAVQIPEGKALSYLEPGQPGASQALEQAGFRREGLLMDQPGLGTVEIWGR